MKLIVNNLRTVLVILSAMVIAQLIVCTTKSPSGPDEGLGDIKISLVQEGVTQTNFYGTDINLIVNFSDTIVCSFDTIKIHSTDARFYIPNESITGQKVVQVIIPLYWMSKVKLPRDSVTGFYYDNVYVQSGLTKSNIVKAIILNLPPFIDSLIVGDTSYKVFHRLQNLNFFTYYLKDTLKNRNLTLKVFAKDLDGTGSLRMSWGNTGEDKYLVWNDVTSNLAIYTARKESFRDTIQLNVYDSSATLDVKINLIQLDGSEIAFDSISYKDNINDTTFRDTSITQYVIKKIAFNDTATIRAYPHKSGGSARFSAMHGKIFPNAIDPNGFAVTYVCTLSNISDTLTSDGIRFVDSIKCIHKNNFGDDSISKTIVLYKKPANKNPVIDSILIDAKVHKSGFKDTVAAGSSIPLKAYAHDPEGGTTGGTITCLWQGKLTGTLYTLTGDSNTYTAANATYIDTLFLFAADSLGFKDTQSIILISNKAPVIDSILIDTIRYKSGFVHVVPANDTIALRGWAHDPEAVSGGGTIKYSWQAQGTLTGNMSSTIGASVSYFSKSGTYTDSLYLMAADSLGFFDIQLIALPCNNTPLIDSIRIGAKKYPVKLTDSIYDTTTAPDTFTIKPKAYDIDSASLGDVITYSWRFKNSSLQVTTSTADSINYISANAAYIDTVSITVTDKYKAKKVKKIFLKFTQ